MKKLACEICGGTDLIKDSGLFVCQTCGCKYTVEEVKRMMTESTENVSPTSTWTIRTTSKVDNLEYVQNYLANARRAYDKQDWEETEKYYNLVVQNNPDNIEAVFYSAYAKACKTLIEADYYKKEAAFGVLTRTISIIDDKYDPSIKEIIEKIGKSILNLYAIPFVYNQKKNGYGTVVQSDRLITINLFNSVGAEFVKSCLKIADTYPETEMKSRNYFYKIASGVADISCHHDYALKIKKLADPWNANIVKKVTIINDYNGRAKMNIYLTISRRLTSGLVSEIFVNRLFPSGTTTIELMPGEYECILRCGINKPSTAIKKGQAIFSVPQHSKIEITWKFLDNGYKMNMS